MRITKKKKGVGGKISHRRLGMELAVNLETHSRKDFCPKILCINKKHEDTVRPAHQEMMAIEKIVWFPRGGGIPPHGDHSGTHQGLSGGRGRKKL